VDLIIPNHQLCMKNGGGDDVKDEKGWIFYEIYTNSNRSSGNQYWLGTTSLNSMTLSISNNKSVPSPTRNIYE